jgi:hypothetical protein
LDCLGLISNMKVWVDNARYYRDVAGLIENAQRAIFKDGAPIGGAVVERLLKPTSTVPMSVRSVIL